MGFELDLKDGMKLRACHVPGRKAPYLGIQQGSTFIALARFISDGELQYLHEVMSKRIFIVEPIAEPTP